MDDLDVQIKAVVEDHERRQFAIAKQVNKGDAMHKAVVSVFDRVERQAEIDRGDVIKAFEC